MSTVNNQTFDSAVEATLAAKTAAREFMRTAKLPDIADQDMSPPQGIPLISQTYGLISIHPGRFGKFARYALDYGLTLRKGGKDIFGVENPNEPDRSKRRLFRRVTPTLVHFQQALQEKRYHARFGRPSVMVTGVDLTTPDVWVKVNSSGMFGGRVVTEQDAERKATGRVYTTEPEFNVDSLAGEAEAIVWRELLGLTGQKADALNTRNDTFHTFIERLKVVCASAGIEVVVPDGADELSMSDSRLVRNIGEKRQPTALPERFSSVASRAAQLRATGVVSSTTTSTATTTTVVAAAAPAPSIGAAIFAAFEAGQCSMDQLQRYMELTKALKAAEEGLKALLAEVKGE